MWGDATDAATMGLDAVNSGSVTPSPQPDQRNEMQGVPNMTKFLSGCATAILFLSNLQLGPAWAGALLLLTFWEPLSDIVVEILDNREIERIRRAATGLNFDADAELAWKALREL